MKIPFTEANLLDKIVQVSNHHSLGLKLGIPPHKLVEIEQHHVEDRKQLLVSAFFRTVPNAHHNWEWVDRAIKQVEIEKWALTRQDSMTKSTSFDRDSLLSASSFEGKKDSSLSGSLLLPSSFRRGECSAETLKPNGEEEPP